MDGMSLLDVLRGVMLDPAEQAAYNADPSAYLGRFGYDDVDPADLSEAFGLVADTLPPDQAQAAWAAASTPDGDAFGAVTADFDSDNGVEPPPEPDLGAPGEVEAAPSLSFGQGEADDSPPAPAAVEPEAGDAGTTADDQFEAADGGDGPTDGSGLDAGFAEVADDFDDADGDGIDDDFDSGAGGGGTGFDADGDGIDDGYDSAGTGTGLDADGDGIDDSYDGGGFDSGLDADGDGIDDGYDTGLDDDLGDLDQIDGLDQLSMPGPDDTDIGSF
jgi:hypothetical protein